MEKLLNKNEDSSFIDLKLNQNYKDKLSEFISYFKKEKEWIRNINSIKQNLKIDENDCKNGNFRNSFFKDYLKIFLRETYPKYVFSKSKMNNRLIALKYSRSLLLTLLESENCL